MSENPEKETGDGQRATGNGQRAISGGGAEPTILRKGGDIADRLRKFALAVLKLVPMLPTHRAGRHVADQYVRSATSAGSNYDEARAAESLSDFIHKVSIAAKEMRETCYWTELVAGSGWLQLDLRAHAREARELSAILGASARTARARADSNR